MAPCDVMLFASIVRRAAASCASQAAAVRKVGDTYERLGLGAALVEPREGTGGLVATFADLAFVR